MTLVLRRDALRMGTLAAALPPTLAAMAPTAAAARADRPATATIPESWVVRPSDNDRVTLGPSLFTATRTGSSSSCAPIGHFLSALALAYAGSGDTFYRDKGDYLVGALGECQDALNGRVGQPAPPTPPSVALPAGSAMPCGSTETGGMSRFRPELSTVSPTSRSRCG
jgi:hypothetical protein